MVGKFGRMFVANWFTNIEWIEKVDSPVWIVHGQWDTLIDKEHSEDLHSKCQNLSQLILPPAMDHNNFDFYDDLASPLQEFMLKVNIDPTGNPQQNFWHSLTFHPRIYDPPDEFLNENVGEKSEQEGFMRKLFEKLS